MMSSLKRATIEGMKTITRGFVAPLLLVIILLALGGGAYYYTQKSKAPQSPVSTTATSTAPDATANWKPFTNQDIGFSIRYPQTWESTSLPREVVSPPSSLEPFGSYKLLMGMFSVGYETSSKTIEEIAASNNWTKSQVTVGGKKGIKMVVPEDEKEMFIKQTTILIQLTDHKVFSISFAPEDDLVYNKILNTIVFTK